MLGIDLHDAAGRTAYLAGFHAAQAFIFERRGKVAKTHRGVRTEFLLLTKDDSRVDSDMRTFLSRRYNLKSIADYETGFDIDIAPETAVSAIAEAKAFVDLLAAIVTEDAAGRN
jgi:uncharacterized protein (UPF0332 family)